MSKQKNKILFLSHEASRTGAPILLLELIKQLTVLSKNQFDITILLNKGGELTNEFKTLGKVFIIEKKPNFIDRFLIKAGKMKTSRIPKSIQNQKFDLIFSNTIVNGKVLEQLAPLDTPVISYIHELEYSIQEFNELGRVKGTLEFSNYFLCGSKLVQENLIKNHSIPLEKTEVIYSFSDLGQFEFNQNLRNQIRKELNLPENNLLVGMVGSLTWRKGPDLFAKISQVFNELDPVSFIWIGYQDNIDSRRIQYETNQNGKKDYIMWLPPTSDYSRYYHAMDLFFLTSREDPYPLVCVEASSIGLPVFCFKNSTGFQEFIDSETGCVISYSDIEIATEKIRSLLQSELKFNRQVISDKSRQLHDWHKPVNRIFELMVNYIEKT